MFMALLACYNVSKNRWVYAVMFAALTIFWIFMEWQDKRNEK
jgi:hypothetical protein